MTILLINVIRRKRQRYNKIKVQKKLLTTKHYEDRYKIKKTTTLFYKIGFQHNCTVTETCLVFLIKQLGTAPENSHLTVR